MKNKDTICNKMLQAVLLDEKLMSFGEYSTEECYNIDVALASDNYIVGAVARIIASKQDGANANEIYKEVTEYLKKKV